MCHADVGLVIYSWQKDRLKPGANGTGHTCANWDKIAQWTKGRTVDMYRPGLIIHPQLGESHRQYCSIRSNPQNVFFLLTLLKIGPAYPERQNDKEHINGALHEHGSG